MKKTFTDEQIVEILRGFEGSYVRAHHRRRASNFLI